MSVIQELVGSFSNIYDGNDFLEMVRWSNDTKYWETLDHENLTDEECVYVLKRLAKIYTEWYKS